MCAALCTCEAQAYSVHTHLFYEEVVVSLQLEAHDHGRGSPGATQHAQHLGHLRGGKEAFKILGFWRLAWRCSRRRTA